MRVVSILIESEPVQSFRGVCAAGQRLAAELKASFEILAPASMPDESQKELSSFCDSLLLAEGLDRLDQSPEAILASLTDILGRDVPRVIIFGNSVHAQEIAPRLAFRLGGNCAGDAQSLAVSTNGISVTRSVYGGKASAVLELQKAPAVVWVRPAVMGNADVRSASGKILSVAKGDSVEPASTLVERHSESSGGVRLEDARVIVSGGRGLGSAAPFERLKALADPMEAELAASRAACDLCLLYTSPSPRD